MPIPSVPSPQKIKILKADTNSLQAKAFEIRREVFVEEQKVSTEEEFDQFENTSHHFVALNEDEEPVGAARWRKTDKGVKLERFAIKKTQRGKKIGSALVDMVLQDIKKELGTGQHLYMHAQTHAVPLYRKFGFKQVGEQFEECHILHYKMVLDT